MVTKTSEQTKTLVESIKADIVVGRLLPNQHLVGDDLAAKFRVSRHVAQAALAMLEQMGLVVHRPNRGVIVRDFSLEQIEQIYKVRVLLQREAAREMPMPASEKDISEIRAIHHEYCRELESGDLFRVNTLNDEFHRRIWAMCPNQYLAEMIERLWTETTGIRWHGVSNPMLLKNSRAHHEQMIEQLMVGDRDGFMALVIDHIMPPLEAFRRAHSARRAVPQSNLVV